MSLTKLTEDLNVIGLLNDKPNDVDGLTASELKAKFDSAVNTIKDYLNNTLTEEIQDTGAANVGLESDKFISSKTVLAALEELHDTIESLELGSLILVDKSITNVKLADKTLTNDKIADLTIVNSLLADDSVTTAKIVDEAVTNDKIESVEIGKVTGDIPTSRLAGTVPTTSLSGTITNAQLAGGIEAEKLKGNIGHDLLTSDAVYRSTSCTLESGATSWTFTSPSVEASNHVIVSPADDDSWTEWVNKGVRLSSQSAGQLIFNSRSTTTTSINVNILIIR